MLRTNPNIVRDANIVPVLGIRRNQDRTVRVQQRALLRLRAPPGRCSHGGVGKAGRRCVLHHAETPHHLVGLQASQQWHHHNAHSGLVSLTFLNLVKHALSQRHRVADPR